MRRIAVRFILVPMFLAVSVLGCAHDKTSILAVRGDAEGDFGRYVGGGTHFGRARHSHDAPGLAEGTWARDYAGLDAWHVIEMRYSSSPSNGDGFGCY